MGKKRPPQLAICRGGVKEVVAFNQNPIYMFLDPSYQPTAAHEAASAAGAAGDGIGNLEHAGAFQQVVLEPESDTEDYETDDELGQDSQTEAAAADNSKQSQSAALDKCRPELQQLLMQQLVPNLLLVGALCEA